MNQEFLDRVWPDNEGTTYMPYMLNGTWYEKSWDIQANIPEGSDIYFSVLTFSGARRRENALPSNWLWADLDEVNPYEIDLQPTIAWQSSPGRYQALWQLEASMSVETLERTNQLLTYKIGADKGGWSVTKVLRIPGTKNYKYEDIPEVKLLWDDGPIHMVSTIWQYVGYLDDEGKTIHHEDNSPPPADTYDKESVIKKAYALLDPRGRRLLMAKEAWGDRSQRLWELENLLFETGMAKEDVYITVYYTVWNKFLDRKNGDVILWQEVLKSASKNEDPLKVSEEETVYRKSKPQLVTYGDLLGSVIDEPQWLIEDWWTMGSHGIVAGLPKSYKSLVTTDMALSIATGRPFMNKFEVNEKGVGPTLIVQVENSPALLKDRIVKMANDKGLLKGATHINDGTLSVTFPANVPMFFYNDFGFDMTMSDCRTAIETIIAREGIRLVVFDPLYLMMGAVDENSSHEIRPILSWLLGLRNKYDVAIMVVHHWGKGSSDKKGRKSGGIKLLGSTTIYGWLESALYLEANPNEDGSSTVVVEREFRERLAPPPQAFKLKMGDIGEIEYGWDAEGVVGTEAKVFSLLATKPMSMTELKVASEMGEKKLRQLMTKLLANGSVTMEQEGKSKIFRLKND
tara:strand:+ start:27041 stop:28924 length:1884 start_codon:yes stop_codon:yes gene_type:complete